MTLPQGSSGGANPRLVTSETWPPFDEFPASMGFTPFATLGEEYRLALNIVGQEICTYSETTIVCANDFSMEDVFREDDGKVILKLEFSAADISCSDLSITTLDGAEITFGISHVNPPIWFLELTNISAPYTGILISTIVCDGCIMKASTSYNVCPVEVGQWSVQQNSNGFYIELLLFPTPFECTPSNVSVISEETGVTVPLSSSPSNNNGNAIWIPILMDGLPNQGVLLYDFVCVCHFSGSVPYNI